MYLQLRIDLHFTLFHLVANEVIVSSVLIIVYMNLWFQYAYEYLWYVTRIELGTLDTDQ